VKVEKEDTVLLNELIVINLSFGGEKHLHLDLP